MIGICLKGIVNIVFGGALVLLAMECMEWLDIRSPKWYHKPWIAVSEGILLLAALAIAAGITYLFWR